MDAYILVISLIIRPGEGGATFVEQFPTYKACIARELEVADGLARKRFHYLTGVCLPVLTGPPRPKPAVKPQAADLAIRPLTLPAAKPAITVKKKKAKPRTVKAKAKAKGKCLSRRYRVVNGKRKWYCKRRA
jgi:hypothetical protein